MASYLAHFPSTVLDAILSLDGMSPCILSLWICGNGALQQKLSSGVTKIKLVDHRDYSFNRLPMLIQNFRILRELTIDRRDLPVLYYWHLRDYVKCLPPTLKKLEIRIYKSWQILSSDSPSESNETPSSTDKTHTTEPMNPPWTFATAFPQLEVLNLSFNRHWTIDDFNLLPPSITDLTIDSHPSNVDETFSLSIPRQILNLTFTGGGTPKLSFWQNLPPQLQIMKWKGEVYGEGGSVFDTVDESLGKVASALPKTLLKLKMNLEHFPSASLLTLPSGLERLETHNTYSYYLNNFQPVDDEVGRHFKNLKYLSTSYLAPSLIRTLSSCIQTISAHTNKITSEDLSPTEWPTSLTELKLDTFDDFDISILPTSGLLTLCLLGQTWINMAQMKLLPQSLLSLECLPGVAAPEINFPPHLTSLHFHDCDSPGDWLQVDSKGLEFDDFFTNEDGDKFPVKIPFDHMEPAHRASIHGLRVIDCFPYHTLPSSLLHLDLHFVMPASMMKYLPLRLKTLKLFDIFQDAEFIPDSPAEMDAMIDVFTIGRLEGICESFDWTQLKQSSILLLLPRTITHLQISADSMAEIVDWSHLPPNLVHLQLTPVEGLPPGMVYQLPQRFLKSLTLRLNTPNDDHIKALPRHIDDLTFDSNNFTQLTPLAALYFPLGTIEVSVHGILEEAISMVTKARNLHEKDENPTTYLELLNGQNQELRTNLIALYDIISKK